jgi:serine/threonine-protein kinase
MAPEQVRREEMLGPPADIWAFGVVAFECLTGHLPFDGTTLIEVFTRIQHGRHSKARDHRRGLPAEVDEWFSMACAQDPAARFGSALVAARALAVSLESRRWEIDLPPPAAQSSNPVLPSDAESDDNLPLSSTLDGSARLLSRARKTLDTHEPVSAPVRAGKDAAESKKTPSSSRPPAPGSSPVAKPETANRSRRWLVAAAAFVALAIVAGVAVMQSERRPDGDRAALATPSAPGPADTKGRLDEADDDAGDAGHPR